MASAGSLAGAGTVGIGEELFPTAEGLAGVMTATTGPQLRRSEAGAALRGGWRSMMMVKVEKEKREADDRKKCSSGGKLP
jgi:hypothetical protein